MNRKLLLFILISSLLVILPVSTASSQFISCDELLKNFNVGVGNSDAYVSAPFHYQSNMYYCGPATLEMVFDYYGEDVSQSEIADVARTYPYVTFKDELRRASHFSNLSTSLGDEMSGNITGYSARKIGYAAFERWGLTIDDLKTLINEGEPLIVLMWWTESKVYGHYRVVVGYNETHIIMHDPWNKDIWGGTYGGANTSMTYSTFLDLWEYSGNWGLWTHPWYIELQMPSTVSKRDDFEVTANITYPCSAPFDIADYPAFSCKATIKLQEGLELDLGETTQHSLGNITVGNSVQTSWSFHASETGFHNISVKVTGIVEGNVGAHGTYPSYNYEDEIGGSCTNSLSIIDETSRVHNIDTGLNYTTIQEVIDAPETLDGHTIFVEEGTYYKHVVVDKSLSLIGENRTGTIIDGNDTGTLMWITANSVAISGFTFCNSGHNYSDCGILIENSRGNNVANNTIINNLYGVRLVNSTNNRLTDNVASENAVAVYLWNSSYNQITRNDIDFVNNSCIALWQDSGNNIIQYNSISRSNCTGIYTNNSNNNTIVFNNVSFNEGGIYLRESSYNILTDNNITFSTLTGLALRNITNSRIYFNTITHNPYGIYSANISNNIFTGNTIADNEYGVLLQHSDNNVFYHNNFISNYFQVSVLYSYSNSWDNDLEGNYWSDYDRKDSDRDGIGDSPYMVTPPTTPAELMQSDHYPLMGIFHSFSTLYDCQLNIISNSSISDFDFDLIGPYQAELAFNVTGETGTQGFCRICIPKALISGSYVVKFNGEVITYPQVIELPCSNETYEYLYINYTHSEHIIEISGTTTIPEFPLSLILPLFMIATLLALIALILYRRKHSV